MNLAIRNYNNRNIIQITVLVIILATALFYIIPQIDNIEQLCLSCDFMLAFRPAVLNALKGESPYAVNTFFSPPWVLILVAPFTLLPVPIGMSLYWTMGSLSVFFSARILGSSIFTAFAILLTPQMLTSFYVGNNDWMVALGLILPPQIGIFFILSKLQLGLPVAFVLCIESFRKGGFREVIRVFLPLMIVSLLSIFIFQSELFHIGDAAGKWWSIDHFPYLIPVGFVLLWHSIKSRNEKKAILVGPMIAPYISSISLPIAIMGLLPSKIDTLLAILGLWIVWLMRGPF
jgi:hypothetical protein